MRFGSADAIPAAARSVSSASWSDTPSGSCTRLNAAWPVATIVAPTSARAFEHTTGSATGSQLTMSCCGAMTWGRPSMTCVTRGTAPAGEPASASSATSGPTMPLLPRRNSVIDRPLSRRSREQHGEGGALARLALDAQLSAMLVDDLARDHEAEARAGPFSAGCERCVEIGQVLRRDARALVRDGDLCARAGLGLGLAGEQRTLHLDPRPRPAREQRIAARQPHRDAGAFAR